MLALKIARLTPSAGSLSESASSAAASPFGAEAHPPQHSNSPKITANAVRPFARPYPKMRLLRRISRQPFGDVRIVFGTLDGVKAASRRCHAGRARYPTGLVARSDRIDQLRRGNVFDSEPDRLEYCRRRYRSFLSAGEDFADFGIDRGI